jgi:WhiB family transcriptional regulator, redox-sensing transcriptional regulator
MEPAPAPVQQLTDDALGARVASQARCADSGLDPDQWFPVSTERARARHEAAAAIAVCTTCPVRAQCLELSLRHWDIGQHGIWGGLIATDRAHLRRRWPAGHRGRPRPAASGMIVRPPFPPVPLGLVQGGDAH